MSDPPTVPADPLAYLTKSAFYVIAHDLRGLLPPPPIDTPENTARRDIAAIGRVAALLPANANEANLATQSVAAEAHGLFCQRLASEHADEPKIVLQCEAQSSSMMRQARAWRSLLLRVQAARESLEQNPEARAAAAQTEQRALRLMTEALAMPVPAPSRPPPPATPPTAAPQPAAPQPAAPQPAAIAAAERYALVHRQRAILIRRHGRLPDRRDIGLVPPDVVHALVTGTTPLLRALDKKSRPPLSVAA
jgi:hypothetical protein